MKTDEELIWEAYNSKHILDSVKTASKYVLDNLDTEWGEDELNEYEQQRVSDYVWKYSEVNLRSEIEIYRSITLKDLNNLNKNKLGIFWSFEKDGAHSQNIHKNETNGSEYVLTGLTSTKNIDWVGGFESYFYYGPDQWECYISPNSTIKIIEINFKTIDPFIGNSGPFRYSIWD